MESNGQERRDSGGWVAVTFKVPPHWKKFLAEKAREAGVDLSTMLRLDTQALVAAYSERSFNVTDFKTLYDNTDSNSR
ncbi:hypothetical protein E6H35_03310 [Candidatus Bathyarchaeota archaeon]|nr:MAG: hypothetical protein E6H35_03310 [Candidatus Bathyarchaeota archaeon]